jgi:hypothetical protein
MTLITIIVTAFIVLISLLIGYGLGITRNRNESE